MHLPACGFLNEDGTRCNNIAIKMALVSELGIDTLIPCCMDCGNERQESCHGS